MAKVLGKGLEALIKMHDTEENNRYLSGQILIDKIIPFTAGAKKRFTLKKKRNVSSKKTKSAKYFY